MRSLGASFGNDMNRFCSTLLLLLSTMLLGGCGLFSTVRVETAQTITAPPSNVQLYLSVDQNGEPVDFLDDGNFTVYENDVRLISADVGLRLLPRDEIAIGDTVLLLDLSGKPDAKFLKQLTRGAQHFVEKVTVTQAVTVLAFDGSAQVKRVASYPRVSEATEPELPDLGSFAGGDASRDLNGATLQALDILSTKLGKSKKRVKLGTLVVHTQGPDLAGRKTDRELFTALEASPAEHYAITPEGAEIPALGQLGEDGSFIYEAGDDLPMRLQDLGMRVRKAWGRHYHLSYCSPARAGTRQVTTVVRYSDAEGSARSGSGESEFVADDFVAGCKSESQSRPSTFAEPSEPEAPLDIPVAPEPGAPVVSPSAVKKKKPKDPAPTAKPAESSPKPDDVVAPPTSGKYK